MSHMLLQEPLSRIESLTRGDMVVQGNAVILEV